MREFMPKDYTQRRNERWETVFPGIGLESILGRILRIARYHNHKSTETMKPFGIKNGEADVLSALLHAGPPYTLNPKDITKHAYRTPGAITNVMDHLEEKGLIRRNAGEPPERPCGIDPGGAGDGPRVVPRPDGHGKEAAYHAFPGRKGAAPDALEAHPAGSGRARGSLGRVPARPGEGIH